jgi:hypothetical protein
MSSLQVIFVLGLFYLIQVGACQLSNILDETEHSASNYSRRLLQRVVLRVFVIRVMQTQIAAVSDQQSHYVYVACEGACMQRSLTISVSPILG